MTDSPTELNEIAPGNIDLDLDAVTFIDASAVGTIVAADSEQTRRHSVLNVRSRNRFVRRVFVLCGFSALLDRSGTTPSG